MTLLNPWGLLGLLAIPIVLYIHMLQRNSRRFPISTLFLLDVAQSERKAGKRLDKLRNSLLLWLNLLAILLLTCLLVQPRKVQSKKIFKAVVVVDASSSMQPFIKDARETLFKDLEELNKKASGLELTLMSSILEEETIYNGGNLLEAQKKLQAYIPSHTGHDVIPALKRAQTIFDSQGLVIFLSDTKRQVPDGVVQVLSGRKINNVGFTGFVANDKGTWRASVRNYGQSKVSMDYFLGTKDKETLVKQNLELKAGAIKTIEGEFFDNDDSLVLRLADDEFKLDNVIYAIHPLKKKLSVKLGQLPITANAFYHKFFKRMPRIKIDAKEEDFFLGPISDAVPADKPGIFWADTKGNKINTIRGGVMAMSHDIMEGLAWERTLLPIIASKQFDGLKNSVPLLKHEGETLIALRETGKGPQLVLKLNLNSTELQSSPAMMILIYRCLEKSRLYKKAYSQVNLECNNILNDPSLKETTVFVDGARNIGLGRFAMSPSPGFFSISEKHLNESQILLKGAVYFADAGEADFSKASTVNNLEKKEINMTEVNRESDFLKPLWVILLLIICFYGWRLLDNKQKVSKQGFEAIL